MKIIKEYKIEEANLFKRNTQNGPEYYVSYNKKEYPLKSKSWEEAQKEAEEIMHKINPRIVVD